MKIQDAADAHTSFPQVATGVCVLVFTVSMNARAQCLKHPHSPLQEILGGPHAAEEKYDAEFFKKFRNQNIVLSARDYARVTDAS